MVTIPAIDDDRTLRCVKLSGTQYVLHTWDTYRRDSLGKSTLGYAFYDVREDEPIFAGEDYHAPAVRSIDSDEVLRDLLGFLTLGMGDTDSEYFESYTAQQIAFRDGDDREHLSMWATESEIEIDVDGDESETGFGFDDRTDW